MAGQSMSYVKFDTKSFLAKISKTKVPPATVATTATLLAKKVEGNNFVAVVADVASPSVENENFKSILKLDIKKVDYENGNMGATVFRIVCINGYKWLQYEGMHGSISQMFQSNVMNGNAQPIQCKN